MKILFGVIGAVVGFVAALAGFEWLGAASSRADPIGAGLMAVFLLGPVGAIAGTIGGVKAAMWLRARRKPLTAAAEPQAAPSGSGLFGSTLKSLAVVLGLVALGGVLYYVHAVSTATPWLNPNAANVVLQFEVRLPPGPALPAVRDVGIELQTDINRMPGEVRAERFRREGEQAVIAGEVDLAFRTPNRQLEIKIKDQPDRVYPIRLAADAPHTPEFGSWQPLAGDRSEIRYRARWPGREP